MSVVFPVRLSVILEFHQGQSIVFVEVAEERSGQGVALGEIVCKEIVVQVLVVLLLCSQGELFPVICSCP